MAMHAEHLLTSQSLNAMKAPQNGMTGMILFSRTDLSSLVGSIPE